MLAVLLQLGDAGLAGQAAVCRGDGPLSQESTKLLSSHVAHCCREVQDLHVRMQSAAEEVRAWPQAMVLSPVSGCITS